MGIILLILFGIAFIGLTAYYAQFIIPALFADHSRPKKTSTGTNKICPKCKCNHCQYYYEEMVIFPARYRTKTKVHLLNPFKPLVEEKTRITPAQTIQVKRYRCTNCGWIFD